MGKGGEARLPTLYPGLERTRSTIENIMTPYLSSGTPEYPGQLTVVRSPLQAQAQNLIGNMIGQGWTGQAGTVARGVPRIPQQSYPQVPLTAAQQQSIAANQTFWDRIMRGTGQITTAPPAGHVGGGISPAAGGGVQTPDRRYYPGGDYSGGYYPEGFEVFPNEPPVNDPNEIPYVLATPPAITGNPADPSWQLPSGGTERPRLAGRMNVASWDIGIPQSQYGGWGPIQVSTAAIAGANYASQRGGVLQSGLDAWDLLKRMSWTGPRPEYVGRTPVYTYPGGGIQGTYAASQQAPGQQAQTTLPFSQPTPVTPAPAYDIGRPITPIEQAAQFIPPSPAALAIAPWSAPAFQMNQSLQNLGGTSQLPQLAPAPIQMNSWLHSLGGQPARQALFNPLQSLWDQMPRQ